jgi:hypothetical protein
MGHVEASNYGSDLQTARASMMDRSQHSRCRVTESRSATMRGQERDPYSCNVNCLEESQRGNVPVPNSHYHLPTDAVQIPFTPSIEFDLLPSEGWNVPVVPVSCGGNALSGRGVVMANLFCECCQGHRRFVPISLAMQIAEVSRSTVYYWMDRQWVHWRELPSGRRVICEASLSRRGGRSINDVTFSEAS